MEDSSVSAWGLLGLFSEVTHMEFTTFFLTGEVPFLKCFSVLSDAVLLMWWAYKVASVFQQKVLYFSQLTHPRQFVPKRSLLESFLHLSRSRTRSIYCFSRGQGLLPVLEIYINCSSEILVFTGTFPTEPETQRNTELFLSCVLHLNTCDVYV